MRNQRQSSKTRESRNAACERCAASCLEDSGRIRKAPEASQWRLDLGDTEEACLHQRRPARTVHSCANCYLQPSLSLTLTNIPTIISSVWRPGPALRRCRGSWLKFVAYKTVQICVCLLSAVFKPRRGILTARQRSRFLSFSDASVLTHHLFKGGIESQSSEITVRSKRMRHERERDRERGGLKYLLFVFF